MTDRELDAAIAEKVMGWNESGSGWYTPSGKMHLSVPGFSTDRNAAALVLERIGELGLKDRFTQIMWVSGDRPVQLSTWQMITATPRQLMEAALACVQEKV